MSGSLSIVYAIRVTYGDGATWSANKDILHTTDRERLAAIVRRLKKQGTQYDLEFEVVEIKMYDFVSDDDVKRSLYDFWGISI